MEWTRETVIAALRGFAERYGEPPGYADLSVAFARHRGYADRVARFNADACWPTMRVVNREFGSLNVALAAAELPCRPLGRPRTAPDVICSDCGCIRSRHSQGPRCSRCNGIAHTVWTAEAIIGAIRRWAAEHDGEPPGAARWCPTHAVRRGHPEWGEEFHRGSWPSVTTVSDRFGSWNAAISAAGFTPRRPGRPLAAVTQGR